MRRLRARHPPWGSPGLIPSSAGRSCRRRHRAASAITPMIPMASPIITGRRRDRRWLRPCMRATATPSGSAASPTSSRPTSSRSPTPREPGPSHAHLDRTVEVHAADALGQVRVLQGPCRRPAARDLHRTSIRRGCTGGRVRQCRQGRSPAGSRGDWLGTAGQPERRGDRPRTRSVSAMPGLESGRSDVIVRPFDRSRRPGAHAESEVRRTAVRGCGG